MKHKTEVDTIALQADFYYESECDETYNNISEQLSYYGYFYNKEEDEFQFKYKTIATISKGSYGRENKLDPDKTDTIYYLAIKLAGLKRYILWLDTASINCLLIIMSYINTHKVSFNVTQFDIALDIYTKYTNVLALCTKRLPKVDYYKANEEQLFATTSYIEKFKNAKHKKEAVTHTCLYSKKEKHNLSYELVRFELSFQKKFLKRNGLNVGLMYNEFSRYHIIYIPNKKIQQQIRDQYDSIAVLRKKDVKELNLERYRLTIDINPMIDLVFQIYCVTEATLGMFLRK